MPLYLTEEQVADLLTPAEALAAVEGSFDRLARGVVVNPARTRIELPDGAFGVMPCVDLELGYAGLTSSARLPGARPSVVVLFSLERAEVAAIVEARLLGERSTAATSVVAVRLLAHAGTSSLGLIGCGRQAAAHAAALREAVVFERVVAWCPDPDRRRRFCAAHDCEPAEQPRDAAECDVVVTATTSRDPVVRGEWLREGALVLAIGANEPSARELDNVVLERASFVCTDSLAQARFEAGDLIEPVERGSLDWLEVHELQQVIAEDLRGREHDEDIVLFKSNGLAAWDIAAAARLVELVS
jgi:alanine dehydrogenase